MVKVTFVVGGGKKVRQKYYEDMGKDIFTVLLSLGYVEDRGAHAHVSCAGAQPM
jgi:hypothetical protein